MGRARNTACQRQATLTHSWAADNGSSDCRELDPSTMENSAVGHCSTRTSAMAGIPSWGCRVLAAQLWSKCLLKESLSVRLLSAVKEGEKRFRPSPGGHLGLVVPDIEEGLPTFNHDHPRMNSLQGYKVVLFFCYLLKIEFNYSGSFFFFFHFNFWKPQELTFSQLIMGTRNKWVLTIQGSFFSHTTWSGPRQWLG